MSGVRRDNLETARPLVPLRLSFFFFVIAVVVVVVVVAVVTAAPVNAVAMSQNKSFSCQQREHLSLPLTTAMQQYVILEFHFN